MAAKKTDIIAALQKEILSLNGIKTPAISSGLPKGLNFMIHHLPTGIFPVNGVHEFLCEKPSELSSTYGFITGLLSSCMNIKGMIVWICRESFIFPPAILSFDINPEKIIFIHPSSEKETLWVIEEALKCSSLSAVIAEINELNFTNSRRFQLLIEQSRVPGFILKLRSQKSVTTACISKWKISSSPGHKGNDIPGVGHPSWKVELLKMRNGKPGSWEIQWRDHSFVELQSPEITEILPDFQKKTG